MTHNIVIMVVGLPGSGKSTAADILKDNDFEVVELGDIWRELLKKNHVPRNDPVATREFTRMIREKEGKDVYARYAYRKIRKNRRMVAIMGVRSTYEMNYLKKKIPKMDIIALLAPLDMRFHRLKVRGKPEDPRTLKGFKWLEQREKQGFMKARSEERHGIMHIINKADYVISNVSTMAKLEKDMVGVLESIKARHSGASEA